MAVLERDTLGVREVRLFGAAVRWAEAEAQRQVVDLCSADELATREPADSD